MAKIGIYWLAPASALGALLAGLIFMVGHHFFYRNLHNTPVSDDALFAFDISQQQINIAVGTAFAYLAKACMVMAISIAFVQMFWRAAGARCMEAAPTLERVDAVHSTLDNAFEMFNLRSWYAHPLLMVVAGLAWLVPIASVITPATLSVRTAKVSPFPVSSMRVANLDFTNTKYLAQMPDTKLPSLSTYQGPQPYYYAYAGASDDLLKITNAVMGNGAILPIAPPGTNTSWRLEFHGPSLECSNVPQPLTTEFSQDFVEYLQHSNNGGAGRNYGYVAWYPAMNAKGAAVPFGANCSKPASCGSDPAVLDLGSLVPHPTEATLNRSSKPLEIMILTRSLQPSGSYNPKEDSALKLRSCQLYNATYQVSFDYSGGSQNVVASATRDPTASSIEHIPGVLHKYMNQQTDDYEYPCTDTGSADLRCCYNHPELLQTLTYQAVMDAFTQRFQGAVYVAMIKYEGLPSGAGTTFYLNTTLMQTKLAQSEDLAYLRTALQSEPEHTGRLTFQAALRANNSTIIADADNRNVNSTGIYDANAVVSGLETPLGDAIEEVFRNLTVSLMSSAALQPNYSSPTAPAPAEVTFHRYHNVYTYSAQKLWLPYGIALALTSLAVVAGLVTMFINQRSFSRNFSSILRAAHGAQLSTGILDEDVHGQDPLPKYLANAKVWLHGAGVSSASNVFSGGPVSSTGPSKVAVSTVRLLSNGEARTMDSDSRSRSQR